MGSLLTLPMVLAQDKKADDPVEEAGADAPIKVRVNLVNVMASVRDKHNAPIPTLTKDDFTVLENGTPQTIKYFSKESDLPLTIGLLIDVSGSQERLIDIEKSAAGQFFQSVMRPKDQAFIISFGADSELLQDLTSSKRLLVKGLEDVKPNFGFQGIHPGPVPTQVSPHGTVLYDAVYLAASDRMSHEVGRKAIVLITDGVDQGSKYTLEKALEYAQKSDAVIYSIYYVDHSAYGGGGFSFGGGGEGYLRKLSNETGGRVYSVDRKHTLDEVFKELQEEMRTQYAIAYTSTTPRSDGSYQKLDIRTKDKDLKVQARKGYYAMAKDDQ